MARFASRLMPELVRVMHFAQDGDTSGFFAQLARFHDRSRFRMLFGTLGTISPSLRQVLEDQRVRVLSLGLRSRASYPAGVLRLAAALRSLQVQMLHTHLFDPSIVGLIAGTVACVPVRIMTRHYSDYHTRIGKTWHTRVDRMCTRLAHAVITVSHQTRHVMLQEEQAPAGKVHTIHNGIDLSRLVPPSAQELEALRRELEVGADVAVVAVVARLHPEKGHEHLFRALPRLLEATGGKLRLLVAGAGPFRAAYEREVAMLGVDEAVRFLGFRTDVARILAVADVVVLPSLAEAFGLVLAEAMFMRKAVVATTAGGIPEIVEDGVSGLLVPPASPEQLADAILSLLRDPACRVRLGEAGRRRVMARFRFETMMERYEVLYDTLLARTRPGALA
jgi:glycosyltransferase involved in cell wall biosynthesis